MALDPFVGEVTLFAGNFAPRGWAFCAGQLLPISQNTALFSLLGTNYGGDGRTTFGLPDLRGRSPLHVGAGQGPGLQAHSLGEMAGEDGVTLTTAQIPAHTHSLQASTAASVSSPSSTVNLAASSAGNVYRDATNPVAMSQTVVSSNGGGLPHNNRQPYLSLNFIIALQGIFPPRA